MTLGERLLKDGATVAEIVVVIGDRAWLRLPNLSHDWTGGDWTAGPAFNTLKPESVTQFHATPMSLLGCASGGEMKDDMKSGVRWHPVDITWGQGPFQGMVAVVRENVFVEALSAALVFNSK